MDYNLFKEELLLAIQDLADPEQSVSLHCIDKAVQMLLSL